MNYLHLFLAIPVIAIFDYLLFRKWLKCDNCGEQKNGWYNYLIPTFIEICLFLAGIAIGTNVK
jgi:hypothetical protein